MHNCLLLFSACLSTNEGSLQAMSLLSTAVDWLTSHPEVWVAVLLILILSPFVSGLVQHCRVYLAFRRIPTDPENQHFFFGHSPKILEDLGHTLDWFRNLSLDKNWKIFKYCYGPTLYQLAVVHPDVAKVVLRGDPKSEQTYNSLEPWLGKGLLIANGPRWARNRRLLTPAFHYDILRPYLKIYAEAAGTMIDLWSQVPEGEPINVFPYISLCTLDVMLQCTCSYYSNCQREKGPYIQAVYQLSDLSIKRIVSISSYFDWMYKLKPDYWQYRSACKTVHGFSMDIIRRRRAALEEKKRRGEDIMNGRKSKYIDFLDILLEAKDSEGVGLTNMEIRAEVDTFVFEGHDTTAAAMAWTLYNLAIHTEHQERCREEVDAIFEEKGEIGVEEAKSLVHLKYCIKESLRLFPPVAANGRVLENDTEICGKTIPRGTPVICFNYAIHRHPDFWENPEVFDPLRFSPENSKNRHSHSFVPFSAGPRNCIGQEFAMNEEKVILAHILRRFELTLDETRPVSKDFRIILRPKDGLFLKLKHRKH